MRLVMCVPSWFMTVVAASAFAGEPLDVRVGLDLRLVHSTADESFLQGGYGRTRFDKDHDDLRLGAAYLSARYRLSDGVTLHSDALGYADGNSSALDVTQLYVQWRPFPSGSIRFSSRVGMFYPEFSFENRGIAWAPMYSITPSAINSWFGEELRTLGTEATLRWLGGGNGYQGDVAVIAGAYGWNDPLGTTVTLHGWNLHDRQTGLTGYVVMPGDPSRHIHEFREIDGRAGFYAGLQWRHGDHIDIRLYRYDNRADPAAVHDDVYAWLTRFDTLGVRWEINSRWTAISQILHGETLVGPQREWGAAWNMDAWFVLLSYEQSEWRMSLRRDEFRNDQYRGFGELHAYDDSGSAWTIALTRTLSSHVQAAAEYVRVDSTFPARSLTTSPRQIDGQLQLALRYKWHH
jgi:hypothetical protein